MGTQSELSKRIETAGLDLPSTKGEKPPSKPSSTLVALQAATKDAKELSAKTGDLSKLQGEELAAAKELKSALEGLTKLIP